VTRLVRALGLISASNVVIGCTIGSGVFLVATDISKSVASPWAALSVWVVAGLLSLVGGLVFAELGAIFPAAGGQYVYIKEAFGPLPGFLYSWTWTLVILPGMMAAIAVGFAQFASGVWPMSQGQANVVASVAIAFLTLINLWGVKKGASLLDFLTSIKVLALVAFAAAGLFFFGRAAGSHPLSNPSSIQHFTFSKYGVALIAAFWAYDGWNQLSQVAGEIKNPQRNVPLASFGGIVTVMVLYVACNLTYFRVLGADRIIATQSVGAETARMLWGSIGGRGIEFIMILSALGCLNGTLMAGARVTYAAAESGNFPTFLGYVHPRYKVPTGALVFQMIWAILLVWTGRYDQLYTYVISASFIFYGLTAASLIWLRRKLPRLERPYRLPFYPWLPLAYLLFTVAFVVNSFVERPRESLIGFGIVLVGIPAYYFFTGPRMRGVRRSQP